MRWVPTTHPGVPPWPEQGAGMGQAGLCCPSLGQGKGVSAWHGCPQVPTEPSLARLGTDQVPALG